jgi:hypothetical protein
MRHNPGREHRPKTQQTLKNSKNPLEQKDNATTQMIQACRPTFENSITPLGAKISDKNVDRKRNRLEIPGEARGIFKMRGSNKPRNPHN